MSTRCNVTIKNKQGQQAMLYKHHDGSPERMIADLQSRLSAANRRLTATACLDPEKVSAVMVADSTDESGIPDYQPCVKPHGDAEFRYDVLLADPNTYQITVNDDVTEDVTVYC